jgi:hypothetical protein
MAIAEQRRKGSWRYAGLVLMAFGVVAVLAIGALAFGKVVTVETAVSAVAASVSLILLPGFLLHIVTVVRARRGSGA